jgi:DDE superfamily endonuclease/Helix-turn-helix of DDE superfamily endonuclease
MAKTIRDEGKTIKKVERAMQRTLRRKRRAAAVKKKLETPPEVFVPNLQEEMTSNYEDFMEDTNNEICIPIDCAYQTDPVICVNCLKDPFVKDFDIGQPVDKSCQTENDILTKLDLANQEIEILRREVNFYQTHAPKEINPLDAESLKNNDTLVKFYTGFVNFAMLKLFFDFCCNFITDKCSKKGQISQFSGFLLAMIKLRLNVPYKDLAFRFGIDETTASRIFVKWVDGMFLASKHIVLWPEKKVRANSMPPNFKHMYGDRIAAIIDCFEIFIVRPSNLKARAQTWSHYKSHNTIKYLISITPQGTVNFISKSWGGRVSDKQITAESGFLDNLKPGDMVMADRGFSIEDLLAPLNCSLAIPSFTRGKSQLTYDDCKKSREIANLRIHVERVIGLLRNRFQILSGIVSMDLLTVKDGDNLPPIDKIAQVCCALINCSNSIVSNGQDSD